MTRRLQLRNGLTVVILALATALALFIVGNLKGNAPEEVLEGLPKNVDLSLQKINYTETRNGRPAWTLKADSATHNLAEGLARIENIRLTFHDPKLGAMRLTADEGQFAPDKQEVAAEGHVEIVSPRGYTFVTDRLDYRDADRLVHSDGPVRLSSKEFTIEGRGLQLNVDDRSLVLKHDVHAEFPHGLNGIAP